MSPAYEQNTGSNGRNHLEMFPRYKSLKALLYTRSRLQERSFGIENKPTFPVP